MNISSCLSNYRKKMIFFIIFQMMFFQSVVFAKSHYRYEVAACAIFQNEAPYLKEWIEFHKLVGVSHFYLFNNLSTDDYLSVLSPYIKEGIVELIDWPYKPNEERNWTSIQCSAYNKALKMAINQAKWLAILDTDEFLFPVGVYKLTEFLKNFRSFAGVVVNWQMYGTSGVQKIFPTDLLIERLILKAPFNYEENVHVKSVVRPKYVKKFDNPHSCVYKTGYYAVNSNKESVFGPFTVNVLVDQIRINHYWTRDEDFFNRVKVPRRNEWKDGMIFQRANWLNFEADTAIFKYVPALKDAISDF